MSMRTNNLKLGVFVLLGVGLLIGGLLAFGARGYFEKRLMFETYISGDVDGLSVGSAVVLRGVRVGKVTRINFTWNEYPAKDESYVIVQFEIREDVHP